MSFTPTNLANGACKPFLSRRIRSSQGRPCLRSLLYCSWCSYHPLTRLNRWRGVRDEELSKITGVPGCIFVHAAGFTGGEASLMYMLCSTPRLTRTCAGHQTKEGAIKLVEMAIEA